MGATEDAASRRRARSRHGVHGVGRGDVLTRVRRILEQEFLLVVLLAAFAIAFVTAFPPTLLVADTWLTLAAGREVWENGLPSSDPWTVLGLERDWTDQQWASQLLAYASHSVGGHALLAVVTATFVVGAFAIAAVAARKLGAGQRAIFLLFFPVILTAPWAWTMRAQVVALPLFTALVWLLASESRNPTRRVYLAFPLVVVWANVHGSVTFAALLTMVLGAIELVSSRGRSRLRSVALIVLAPLAVLVTPYGPVDTARYYDVLLFDPPFPRELVTEWRASDLATDTLFFYALAAAALVLVAIGRRRLTLFDMAALGLTFAGGVYAIRAIPWFALTCMVLLPVAVGMTFERKAPHQRRRIDGIVALTAVGAVVVAVALALVRDESWYVQRWPEEAVAAVEDAVTGSDTRVYANSRDADWMLWRIPELRGRIAYDVRFEIYDRATFERIVRFKGEQGADWKAVADGYEIVVLETGMPASSQVPDFLREPGAETLFGDERVTVIRRRQPG